MAEPSTVLARVLADPRARCAALAVLAAAFLAWRTLADAVYLHHPLPYWDYWDFIEQLPRFLSFDFGPVDLWAQHNEHRILTGRLVFLADALWFGGNGILDVAVSCLIQCAHAAVLAVVVARDLPRGPVRILLAAVVAGCLMFGSQSVNLFWSFQVPFVLVYLAITASLLQLSRPRPGAVRVLAAALLGFLACGSMANGLLVWPLLWSLCVQLRQPRRILLFLVVAGLAVIFLFFHGYQTGHSMMESVRDPVRFAMHVCVLLGNPLWTLGIETAAIAGAVTLLLAAWTVVRRLRTWFQASPSEALLLHLVLLVLGSTVLCAMSRLYLAHASMLHPRYGLMVLILWAALFGLWFRGPRPRADGWWRISTATAFVLGLAILAPRQREPQTPMYEYSAYATACLLTGVRDLDCMQTIHGRESVVTLGRVEILRSRRLSVFGTGLQDLLGEAVADHFDVAAQGPVRARVGTAQPVNGDPGAVRLEGFAWQERTGLPPDLIVLADERGRIAGLGMCRLGHDEGNARSNWQAWARQADHSGPLSVYAVWGRTAVPIRKTVH